MALDGLPPEPLRLIPRFKDPLLSSPHRWLPVLLLPKLEMPLLPTPKLRYPTLSRPMFPRASAVQADAPLGKHSSAIIHLHDGHQQLVPELRSMPSAASISTSSVASLIPPAPANPSALRRLARGVLLQYRVSSTASYRVSHGRQYVLAVCACRTRLDDIGVAAALG